MEIAGTLAVVTGAAVGIGRAIAIRLAAAGASVVIADIDAPGGTYTRDLIGRSARFVELDLRNDHALTELMTSQPQILINNAGGGAVLTPCYPDATPARWSASLDLNLRAPMLATQLALPTMESTGGVIVNIGSTAGIGFGPHISPEYSAAKAGLIRFTTTLAPRLQRARINCVVPDWVATERGLQERAALPPEEQGPPLVPLETVTDNVLRFIKDDTLTGQVVLLDRGREVQVLNDLVEEPLD
ncbi:hypothetical protein GCM10009804_67150 [Kribbella hippodromi]|uniref:SDR family oxidoreductase n=1 Tax=Kribbella hippodromi TaxID=434347 RepID=A0ABP4Q8W9_9ACTN